MAFCAKCGHEISDLATACPQCGQPTGARLDSELAGWWLRFAAAFIDGLILFIPGILIVVLSAVSYVGTESFGSWGGVFGAGGPGRFGFSPLSWLGSALGFLYNWLMIGLNNGQTVGKMVCGIRILHPDKRPVDLGVAAARAGMAIVSGLPFHLGYLWAAWDPEKRTWHDMVANTRAFRVLR